MQENRKHYLETHLDVIRYFSQSIFRRNTVEDILWDITSNCIQRLGFVDCVAYLVDYEKGTLIQKAAFGAKSRGGRQVVSPMEIPIGKGIVGTVAESGSPELILDCSKDFRYIADDDTRLSEICVPIIYNGSVLGVIDSEHPEANFYTKEHLHILSSIASISATKIARTLVEEKNEVLARFVMENPNPVFRVDRVGKVLNLNKAALQSLKALKIEDNLVTDLKLIEKINEALESGGNEDMDIVAGDIILNLKIVPIISRNYVNVYASDITELKLAKIQAEKASHAKDEFLSIVSHEMRTPLNGILGMTKLLSVEDLNDKQHGYLQTLDYSGRNLLTLINDVLDIEKIEAGKVYFEAHTFNLHKTMAELYNSFIPKAEERNNKLVLKLHGDVPEVVVGDQTRLLQILNNLVSNAIKFTANGLIELKISHVSSASDRTKIRFVIEDTGIGIPEEKKEKIFNAFEQAETSTNRKFGGTGLGLTITKKLVELLKGNLEFKSEIGKGSAFEVTLDLETSSDTNNNAQFDIFSFEKDVFKGVRILIVDDNAVNLMIAEQFLKNWGATIFGATNGLEAIDQFMTQEIDIILMDIQMPVCDGYEATQKIRMSGRANAHIPILAITADVMFSSKKKISNSGLNDYITKPFNPEDLMRKIQRWLAQAKDLDR